MVRKAAEQGIGSPPSNFSQDYSESAFEKIEKEDDYGAIADITKAIEINPNYAEADLKRGAAKRKLKDDYGAEADYLKAIEIDSN